MKCCASYYSLCWILIFMVPATFGKFSSDRGVNNISYVVYMPPYVVRDIQPALELSDLANITSDVTYTPHPQHFMFYVIFYANCATFILGMIGNTLLITIYARVKTIRTNANTYILSIAVTDLLVTLTCALAPILTDLAGTWPFDETTCKFSQSVMEFSTYATVLTLTALSAERYYAVVYPLESHSSTKRLAMVVNTIIWMVSLICSIPKFMNSGIRRHRIDGIEGYVDISYCVIHQDKTDFVKFVSLFDFFVFYTIPLCIVCVLHTRISRHLMKTTKEVSATSRMSVGQVKMARIRYQVAKMVMVLSAIFFVGFLPHNILILRLFFLEVTDSYWNSVASYAYCYGCVHFWMNPIALYACCDSIRKHFNEYLFCGFCAKRSNKTTPELPVQEFSRNSSS